MDLSNREGNIIKYKVISIKEGIIANISGEIFNKEFKELKENKEPLIIK